MKSLKLASASLAGAGVALTVGTAYAHGFGNRYDLPVPLNLFLVGAGATVALSFVVIGFFVQRRSGAFTYPRFNLLRSRWSSTILAGPVSLGAIRTASVAVFLLTVATAMLGSNIPVENLSPTLVWIIWWVGMGYVSALGGNLWMLINPWKITFEWLESLFGGGSKTAGEGMYRYPEGWDVWPALLLFLAFAWTENVYSGASEPFKLGLLILLYSLVTWTGMFVFGKHQWLRHGEAFSVLFGIFARFSPTEVRVADPRVCRTCPGGCEASEGGCVDCYQCFERAAPANREFNLRPIAVGLASRGRVSTPTALFVILALATVTFDGLTATPGWVDFQTATFSAASIFGSNTLEAIDTAGLVMLPVVFVTVYLAFAWAIRHLSREREISVPEIARTFVQPGALHLATRNPGPVHRAACVGSFRRGVGPVRDRGLHDQHRNHQRQIRLVRIGGGHRAGAHHLCVHRPRHLAPVHAEPRSRPPQPVPYAAADGTLHRHQPVDHRPAHRRPRLRGQTTEGARLHVHSLPPTALTGAALTALLSEPYNALAIRLE